MGAWKKAYMNSLAPRGIISSKDYKEALSNKEDVIQKQEEMKYCKECDKELPKTDFYKTVGNCVQTLCKVHTNEKRKQYYKDNPKPKKVKGFIKLDEEIRKLILEDLKNNMKIKPLAVKYDLNYNTLLNWKKTGQLV